MAHRHNLRGCTGCHGFRPNPEVTSADLAFSYPEAAGDCRTLEQAAVLIQATLEHLQVPPTPVSMVWSRKTLAHGMTKRGLTDAAKQSSNAYRAQLNTEIASHRVTTQRARQLLTAFNEELVAKAESWGGVGVELSKPAYERISFSDRVQTVVHEACHVAMMVMHPGVKERQSGHGPMWSAYMKACGLAPERFTTGDAAMETSPSLTCGNCATPAILTAPQVVKVKQGHVYPCPKCFTPMGLDQLHVPDIAAKRVQSAEKKAARRSPFAVADILRTEQAFRPYAPLVERAANTAVAMMHAGNFAGAAQVLRQTMQQVPATLHAAGVMQRMKMTLERLERSQRF